LLGVASFIVFALPMSPAWLGWPALLVTTLCGLRLIVVGDRHHQRVKLELELDNEHEDEPGRSRTDELVRILRRTRD
jgi:hypothetical protein